MLSTDRTEKGIKFLTALESYDYPIYALMYHPEYQMLEYLSQTTLNTIDNKDTIDIIEHLGHFIYRQALQNRKLNKGLFGEKFAIAEQAYHDELLSEDMGKLWGRIQPYHLGPEVIIEAYSIPSTSYP